MRILSITAGAPGMLRGTCLRDNSLAKALLASGHDVTLVPIYTPTHTDEPNLSRDRVFFGGVSAYSSSAPIFRRLPAVLDRLWTRHCARAVEAIHSDRSEDARRADRLDAPRRRRLSEERSTR
jgi:hypothetical protein